MKYVVTLCSAIIWGSGQAINKQWIKAAVFFIVQCIFWFVELSTGLLDVITGQAEPLFRNCGYFIRGVWGLVTLGEIPRLDSSVLVFDHSVMLMIGGIISTFILLLFVFVWIWNIKDAYKTHVLLDHGTKQTSLEYVKGLWEKSFEYIMITPGALLVLFISVIPVLFSISIAFTNYNRNTVPPRNLIDWTGFQTFRDIIEIPIWGTTFVSILIWTVCWAFLATFSAYSFGLLNAVLINTKGIRFKKFWRGLYVLPWAVPGLVSLLVFRAMFNRQGAFNTLLMNMGIIDEALPFLSNSTWARTILVLTNVWLGFPYFMSLISGVMTSISPELYEAVDVDGGGGWTKFRAISLPAILTATAPQIVMSITFNFNNFGHVYFLTQGGPPNPSFQMAGSTDILITWLFKLTLDQRMYNYAAAISIIIFIMIATVSGFNLMRTRAFKED